CGKTWISTSSATPQIIAPETKAAAARSRALRFACLRRQQPLGELAKPLAANRVSRLHDERIERPEAVLRQAQQLPAAKPADSDDNHKQEGRPNASKRGSKLARKFTEPDRGDDRRDP